MQSRVPRGPGKFHVVVLVGIMIKSSIVWLFTVFIEMQQYKGPGDKKFCNTHSRSSLDLLEWAAFGTIDLVRIFAYR